MTDCSALVSIVMPAYNVERYIAQAIESVISQTLSAWELIIVDDCSTDGTAQVIGSYADKEQRIVFVRNEQNGGSPSKARNKALKFAGGRYIAFLDSDDWWEPAKLEIQIAAMQKGDYALSHTGGIFVFENDGHKKIFTPACGSGDIFGELLMQYEIKTLSVVLDRDKLLTLHDPFFDESLKIGEDYHLFMRLASKYDVLTLPDKLFFYRVRTESVTRTNPQKLWEGMEKFLRWLQTEDRELAERYKKETKFATAKIGYYKAKYYMASGLRKEAAKELSGSIFLNWRYFVLFVAAVMPMCVWRFMHKISRR